MPRVGFVVAILLVVQPAVPAGSASLADDAERAFVDLKLASLAGEEPERDPLERLREDVLDGEQAPEVTSAWRQARNASTEEAPRAVVEAEAALLELASQRVHAWLEAGNASAAHAWLQIALERAGGDERTLAPAADVGPAELDREKAAEALHAAIAVSAREAAWEAFLWKATGEAERAQATAEGAGELAEVLVPEAGERLPEDVREPFAANATNVSEAVLAPAGDEERYLFPGLAAGLTALQYDHDVEELEVLGQRAIDGSLVATRAAHEDPDSFATLGQAAYDRYTIDRGRLGLMGEGTNDGLDEAYLAFRDAVRNGSLPAAEQAADRIRQEASELALLGTGVVFTVESGGVRQDRAHGYDASLVRPSLEGISGYEVELSYDGDVLDVVDVVQRAGDGSLAWEGGGTSGTLTVTLAGSEPIREASHLFQLQLEAAGVPGDETMLRAESFQAHEPDEDPLETFLVRHGNVTLAEIETPNASEDEAAAQDAEASNPTPGATLLGTLLAGLLAASARRRGP